MPVVQFIPRRIGFLKSFRMRFTRELCICSRRLNFVSEHHDTFPSCRPAAHGTVVRVVNPGAAGTERRLSLQPHEDAKNPLQSLLLGFGNQKFVPLQGALLNLLIQPSELTFDLTLGDALGGRIASLFVRSF